MSDPYLDINIEVAHLSWK